MNRSEFAEALYQRAVAEAFPSRSSILSAELSVSAVLSDAVAPISGRPLYCVRLFKSVDGAPKVYADVVLIASVRVFQALGKAMYDTFCDRAYERMEGADCTFMSKIIQVSDVYYKDQRETLFSFSASMDSERLNKPYLLSVMSVPTFGGEAKLREASVSLSDEETLRLCDFFTGGLGDGKLKV